MIAYPSSNSGTDCEFVEVPLILDREQMIKLEALALKRGQSVGSLLRQILRICLAKANEPETRIFKSSA